MMWTDRIAQGGRTGRTHLWSAVTLVDDLTFTINHHDMREGALPFRPDPHHLAIQCQHFTHPRRVPHGCGRGRRCWRRRGAGRGLGRGRGRARGRARGWFTSRIRFRIRIRTGGGIGEGSGVLLGFLRLCSRVQGGLEAFPIGQRGRRGTGGDTWILLLAFLGYEKNVRTGS